MYKFFRHVMISFANYYIEALVLNGWDSLSNLLKLDFADLVYYGERAILYAKKSEVKK